jgi:hypothetical protein
LNKGKGEIEALLRIKKIIGGKNIFFAETAPN